MQHPQPRGEGEMEVESVGSKWWKWKRGRETARAGAYSQGKSAEMEE